MKNTDFLFKNSKHIWDKYLEHPFLKELGSGTLPKDKFQFYLLQDYVYLHQYAKVFSLGFAKTDDTKLQQHFLDGQNEIFKELLIHKQYMLDMQIDTSQIKNLKTSIYSTAYTSYMLSIGYANDTDDIISTLLPCAWSYSYISKKLKETFKDSGFYNHWVNSYSSDDFFNSWQWMEVRLNSQAYKENKLLKMSDIFLASSEFEYMFWDMAYNKKTSV